jgi:hypothetical protein
VRKPYDEGAPRLHEQQQKPPSIIFGYRGKKKNLRPYLSLVKEFLKPYSPLHTRDRDSSSLIPGGTVIRTAYLK